MRDKMAGAAAVLSNPETIKTVAPVAQTGIKFGTILIAVIVVAFIVGIVVLFIFKNNSKIAKQQSKNTKQAQKQQGKNNKSKNTKATQKQQRKAQPKTGKSKSGT